MIVFLSPLSLCILSPTQSFPSSFPPDPTLCLFFLLESNDRTPSISVPKRDSRSRRVGSSSTSQHRSRPTRKFLTSTSNSNLIRTRTHKILCFHQAFFFLRGTARTMKGRVLITRFDASSVHPTLLSLGSLFRSLPPFQSSTTTIEKQRRRLQTCPSASQILRLLSLGRRVSSVRESRCLRRLVFRFRFGSPSLPFPCQPITMLKTSTTLSLV